MMPTIQEIRNHSEMIDQLSADDKVNLNQFFEAGVGQLQEIEDLKDSLRDLAKARAEELNVKPAVLMKALRLHYKSSLQDAEEEMEAVRNILVGSGRA